MKPPFTALENEIWKIEITNLDPLEWILYGKNQMTGSTWARIEPTKQIQTLNEVISFLLKEKFIRDEKNDENERFIPAY